jgi:undecaprenyl-diphosphatase
MPNRRRTIPHLIWVSLWLLTCSSIAPSQNDTASSLATGRGKEGMTVGQAVILGVVEGLTEYLPISSTGHLLIAERIMGIGKSTSGSSEIKQRTKDASDAYTICIQLGAIIAVLGLYFRRVRQMTRGLLGKDPVGRRLLLNVAAGFLPAAIIGLLFNKTIKTHLFGPWPVVMAWFIGGLAILAVSRRNQNNLRRTRSDRSLDNLTWQLALIIGFAQCIAMWPGVSRSLVTIVGGLLVGLSMSATVEYSFLLGMVTLGAATVYDALRHGEVMLQTFDVLSLTIGLVFAFVSAIVSVKWMVTYLKRHGLALFGYYRVGLAVVTALLLVTHMI